MIDFLYAMMYKIYMIRTQIYLTPKQHTLLKRKAHEEKFTLSDAVRKIVDKDLRLSGKKEKRQNAGKWLLSMAEEAEKLGAKGPPDLASNVDKYLYGEI